jgi:Tn3 transposase DDE domain
MRCSPAGCSCSDRNAELAYNRRDEHEMSVFCLRICQATMVYANVLMIQHVLDEPGCDCALTSEDERGLTRLFWSHVLPMARSSST